MVICGHPQCKEKFESLDGQVPNWGQTRSCFAVLFQLSYCKQWLFCDLFSVMVFTFLSFLLVILPFKKARVHRAECSLSVAKNKEAGMCPEEKGRVISFVQACITVLLIMSSRLMNQQCRLLWIRLSLNRNMSFPEGWVVKNPPANAGDPRDAGSILGSGRSPGGGNGNPLQYSCLGNSMDRGAWRAAVHEVTESQTQLSRQARRQKPTESKAVRPTTGEQVTGEACRSLVLEFIQEQHFRTR